MRAFVLSGGGNLGPLQVGALRALLEREIVPDMLVGCSAGALNAAFLARNVSLAQVDFLEGIWRAVRKQDVYPGGQLQAMWRFFRGKDSLYDNRKFYAFLQRWGTTPATTFEQFRPVRLFVTATALRSGRLHVFGDQGGDLLLDALMASTAMTPMHPPWEVNGERYIDGGTITPLPLRVALDRGAKEIYSLHIVGPHELGLKELGSNDLEADDVDAEAGLIRGVVGTLRKSVSTMLHLQAQRDLQLVASHNRVRFHHIQLYTPNPPASGVFSGEEEMFARGYEQAMAVLRARHKHARTHGDMTWWRRIRQRGSSLVGQKEINGSPAGTREGVQQMG